MKTTSDEQDLIDRVRAALSDRFADISRVGAGAMAVVFRARAIESDEIVAIKVFRPELSSVVNEGRFRQEGEISSGFQHPNLMPVLESGVAGGLLYLTMPFVEGDTLGERIRREGPLPVHEVLRIAEDIGAGLAYAHSEGFLHRDIKPSNILLGSEGAVLTDFGVAKALNSAGGPKLTSTGFSVGTPLYMSPEQGAGQIDLDVRSDQYSLACVLYEALIGEPPFTGPTPVVVVARHIHDPPPALSTARPGVPPGLQDAVHRALAKMPADRFANVSEFVRAIGRTDTRRGTTPHWSRVGVGSLGAVVLGWLTVTFLTRDLDPNQVLVFPPDAQGYEIDVGDQVATYIGYVLEGTDPLVWREGRDWLEGDTRVEDLSHRDRLRIARRAGVGYFVDGAIVSAPDSVTVILRLFDTRSGDLVERAGQGDVSAEASEARLGARAMGQLLGAIIETGRVVDLGALADRSPVAITRFHQGEVEYRRSRFSEALVHYQQAMAVDEFFPLAAVKGAQAANWLEDAATASSLAETALQQDSLLPMRYRVLAQGIAHKHAGRADSALVHFAALRTAFPDWAEPVAGAAEVYYHFLPSVANLDSLAKVGFEHAVELDSAFTPPLYHLAEIAIRDGDLALAGHYIDQLTPVDPDAVIAVQLEIMMECARNGPADMNWEQLREDAELAVIGAAQAMSSSPPLRACGRAGADVVLRDGSADYRWGSYLLYSGLLVADGETDALSDLIQSEHVADLPAHTMLMIDAMADPTLSSLADSVYSARTQETFDSVRSPTVWLLMHWARARGYDEDVRSAAGVLIERDDGSRLAALFAGIAEALTSLVDGDTANAMDRLQTLRTSGTVQELVWNPWESLVLERLVLAELMLEHDDAEGARTVLSRMSSHRSVMEVWLTPAVERLMEKALSS